MFYHHGPLPLSRQPIGAEPLQEGKSDGEATEQEHQVRNGVKRVAFAPTKRSICLMMTTLRNALALLRHRNITLTLRLLLHM